MGSLAGQSAAAASLVVFGGSSSDKGGAKKLFLLQRHGRLCWAGYPLFTGASITAALLRRVEIFVDNTPHHVQQHLKYRREVRLSIPAAIALRHTLFPWSKHMVGEVGNSAHIGLPCSAAPDSAHDSHEARR